MIDLYEPKAACGYAKHVTTASRNQRQFRSRVEMRIAIAAFVIAVGTVAFTGSGKTASAAPGRPAVISGYEAAAFAAG